jgi:hypothetical protein
MAACSAETTVPEVFSMHKLITVVAAVILCSAFAPAEPAAARGGFGYGGGFHGGGVFHGGFGEFHGLHGFYGGLYPYSLLRGYYPGIYPYSAYEDDGPDCDFVWVKRTVNHKIVPRGIWKCL